MHRTWSLKHAEVLKQKKADHLQHLLETAEAAARRNDMCLLYIITLHVYITTVQSTSQTSLCVLSPPFSLALSAVVVSARRPDVVALETHKV